METRAEYNVLSKARAAWMIVGMVVVIVGVSWSGFLDRGSDDYVDDAFARSALAYAAARSLNGVVSVVQSTTFSFSMLGGVSVAGGEILDPINDLVEQYSTLMKFSIGSLLVQKVLIDIVSDNFFKIAITLSGLLLILSILIEGNPYINTVMRAFIFIVFLRFILVVVILLNGLISTAFIERHTTADVSQISAVSSDLSEEIALSAEDQQIRETASESMEGLSEQRDLLIAERQQLEAPLERAIEALQSADAAVSSARSQVGLLDRFRSGNPEIDSAIQARDRVRDELRIVQEQYDEVSAQLEQTQRDITQNENIIAGRPNSLMERAQGQMSGMVGAINPERVSQRIEDSITNIISVMSLFFFETLILPLFFLFLLSKGMSSIWGVDLRNLLSNSHFSRR